MKLNEKVVERMKKVMNDMDIKLTKHNIRLIEGLLKKSNHIYEFNKNSKNIKWVEHVIHNNIHEVDDELE